MLSLKYCLKYVYRGHDRAAVYIHDSENCTESENDDRLNHDETKQFIDNTYVGASEACWRSFEKKVHGIIHSIVRLPVHLPTNKIFI